MDKALSYKCRGGSAVFSHVSNRESGEEEQPSVQVTLVNGRINIQTQRQTRIH